MIDWSIEGIEFGGLPNCSYGCPCQFEAVPTHGDCRGFEVIRIDRGHFGDLPLDGLNVALLYAWPGPIFEGGGELQAVVDVRATRPQREVLLKVLMGDETEEGATHWWVYRAMSTTVHPRSDRPIVYEVDLEARRARVSIPGMLESGGPPDLGTGGQEHGCGSRFRAGSSSTAPRWQVRRPPAWAPSGSTSRTPTASSTCGIPDAGRRTTEAG